MTDEAALKLRRDGAGGWLLAGAAARPPGRASGTGVEPMGTWWRSPPPELEVRPAGCCSATRGPRGFRARLVFCPEDSLPVEGPAGMPGGLGHSPGPMEGPEL